MRHILFVVWMLGWFVMFKFGPKSISNSYIGSLVVLAIWIIVGVLCYKRAKT